MLFSYETMKICFPYNYISLNNKQREYYWMKHTELATFVWRAEPEGRAFWFAACSNASNLVIPSVRWTTLYRELPLLPSRWCPPHLAGFHRPPQEGRRGSSGCTILNRQPLWLSCCERAAELAGGGKVQLSRQAERRGQAALPQRKGEKSEELRLLCVDHCSWPTAGLIRPTSATPHAGIQHVLCHRACPNRSCPGEHSQRTKCLGVVLDSDGVQMYGSTARDSQAAMGSTCYSFDSYAGSGAHGGCSPGGRFYPDKVICIIKPQTVCQTTLAVLVLKGRHVEDKQSQTQGGVYSAALLTIAENR